MRESIERILATEHPSKRAVAARHAQARAAARSRTGDATKSAGGSAPGPESSLTAGQIDGEAADNADAVEGESYAGARTRRERHLADLAETDVKARRGELLDRDAVRATAADAVTQFRTRLESLATTLGPQLAPIAEEDRCTGVPAKHFEHLLEELARQFRGMTPGAP